MEDEMEEPLMTVADLLAYLRVGRSKFYLMLSEGKLPQPIRIGSRSPRWDPEEIRAWFRHGNERD